MKKISRRKFVFCNQIQRDVPLDAGESCCEFFDNHSKCEFNRYNSNRTAKKISYREELYKEFSNHEEE